jgi:ribosomal protein L4
MMELKSLTSRARRQAESLAARTRSSVASTTSADAPGRGRVPGERPPGHARPEGTRRSTRPRRSRGGRRAPAVPAPVCRLARCGAVAARIFPNLPDENFTHKVNRKMYRAGMCSILSQLVRAKIVCSVSSSSVVDSPKTKLFAAKIKTMGLSRCWSSPMSSTRTSYLSSRNLPNVLVLECARPIRCR